MFDAQGTYSEIYWALDFPTGAVVAIKVEKAGPCHTSPPFPSSSDVIVGSPGHA